MRLDCGILMGKAMRERNPNMRHISGGIDNQLIWNGKILKKGKRIVLSYAAGEIRRIVFSTSNAIFTYPEMAGRWKISVERLVELMNQEAPNDSLGENIEAL